MSLRNIVSRASVALAGVGLLACNTRPAGPSRLDGVSASW